MPNLIDPELPRDVEIAVALSGSRAQAHILRYLSLLGPSSAGQLASSTGMSRASLNRHLVALEGVGAVAADTVTGSRAGKTVLYTIQVERVCELTQIYLRYISGE